MGKKERFELGLNQELQGLKAEELKLLQGLNNIQARISEVEFMIRYSKNLKKEEEE